jgi:hypothetical protein
MMDVDVVTLSLDWSEVWRGDNITSTAVSIIFRQNCIVIPSDTWDEIGTDLQKQDANARTGNTVLTSREYGI